MLKRNLCSYFILLCFCITPLFSVAETTQKLTHPAQIQLRNNIDFIMGILQNDKLNDQQKIKAIENYANDYLDYQRIAALSVGLQWKNFSNQQKRNFVSAFKNMMINLYAKSGLSYGEDANVHILPRVIEDANNKKVSVLTEIINRNNNKFIVEYQLYRADDIYKIYNIKVDNISFITIYRNQFNDLISKKGIDGFIDEIKNKWNSGNATVPNVTKPQPAPQ